MADTSRHQTGEGYGGKSGATNPIGLDFTGTDGGAPAQGVQISVTVTTDIPAGHQHLYTIDNATTTIVNEMPQPGKTLYVCVKKG